MVPSTGKKPVFFNVEFSLVNNQNSEIKTRGTLVRNIFWSLIVLLIAGSTQAVFGGEYLVKLSSVDPKIEKEFLEKNGGTLTLVSSEGRVYKWASSQARLKLKSFKGSGGLSSGTIQKIEPNRKLKIFLSPELQNQRSKILSAIKSGAEESIPSSATPYPDNPEIKKPAKQSSGSDPLFSKQWGMISVDATGAWKKTPGGNEIVVAVTDSGVDYNHQDLIANMWRNTKEIPDDGKDNDGNGYIDDVVGWDFASNDNKPYDLTLSLMDIILKGGNPGHGTHVAGCIGASLNNRLGISGLAPKVKLMALRFISESGQGGTAEAIAAIDYAANNGAHIINASWGGESDGEQEEDTLLKEAIERAGKKGVLFLAAAGNGRMNAQGGASGFDIDNDPKPVYPAAYPLENVFTVAALDSENNLAEFSNWGEKSVRLGAPGVKILSTVPGDKYQDTIINLGSVVVTWDGTSMATPHVAGAAAALWSADPNATAESISKQLVDLSTPTDSVAKKVSSGGRLDLHELK